MHTGTHREKIYIQGKKWGMFGYRLGQEKRKCYTEKKRSKVPVGEGKGVMRGRGGGEVGVAGKNKAANEVCGRCGPGAVAAAGGGPIAGEFADHQWPQFVTIEAVGSRRNGWEEGGVREGAGRVRRTRGGRGLVGLKEEGDELG